MSAFHGSDLEKIEAIYGIPRERIISFAANVSPMGISEGLIDAMKDQIRCIERYPERDYTKLRRAISSYCKAEPDHIIVGNGSSELIGDVIKYHGGKKALIVAPAYSEYERYVKLAKGTPVYHDLREDEDFRLDLRVLADELERSGDDTKLLIICNPSNPTSTAVRAEDMRDILALCDRRQITCVVDETYVDFADDGYDMSYLAGEYRSLFVIRSMSKFFSAPGLRLGYAITSDEELKGAVEEIKDPWSVSSFSETAAGYMLTDEEYIAKVREYIKGERERICRRLDSLKDKGLKYYEPEANFVLVRLPEGGVTAADLFETLIKQGMMIRDCSTFRGLDERYVRFCFMRKEDDDRLIDLMTENID